MLQILLRAVASVPRERIFTRGLCRGCANGNCCNHRCAAVSHTAAPSVTHRLGKNHMRFSNFPQVLRVAVATMTVGALAAVTQAQTPATAPDAGKIEIEEVVITGSRIALPNMVSTSPIQVITEKDIRVSGKADISDIILQLPQNFNNSFSDFNNRTSGLTTAGGLATADLRGLGPQRTLVLVNGRRLGVGDANTANPNPASDLDQIPTALIERVDVVTGGASATYGSDAIGGVVNFIMRRDFQGIEIGRQYGQNWHSQHNSLAQSLEIQDGITPPTGTIRDGTNRAIDLVLG